MCRMCFRYASVGVSITHPPGVVAQVVGHVNIKFRRGNIRLN